MAGTDVSAVTVHFPKPQGGFNTTTSGAVSSAATTVGLNSTGNYNDGDVGVWIIDPTDSNKKQVFVGVVDTGGSQVTGVKWVSGTNQAHSSGATVVDYVTAAHIQMISKGMRVEHNENGTHDNTKVAMLAGAQAFSGAKTFSAPATFGGNATFNSQVNINSVDVSAAFESWVPSYVNITVGNGTVVAKNKQIGKTVHFKWSLTFGNTTSISTGPTVTLPVASAVTESGGTFPLAITDASDTSIRAPGLAYATTTGIIKLQYFNVNAVAVDITATAPVTFATGDVIEVRGTYEAP